MVMRTIKKMIHEARGNSLFIMFHLPLDLRQFEFSLCISFVMIDSYSVCPVHLNCDLCKFCLKSLVLATFLNALLKETWLKEI